MNRFLRSSVFTLAVGYILFGMFALICFAAPLWYAWQVTIREGRAEILREDASRLEEVFHREGAPGLTAFIQERVGLQIPNERILLLTDPDMRPLSGNLAAWPPGIPSAPGIYTRAIDLGSGLTPVELVRAVLPGGYNLLVGRDTSKFAPLEMRFWSGLTGAVAVLSIVGVVGGLLIRRALLARIESIGQTATAVMRGDLSHRLPIQERNNELETLSRTINRMLDQIEQLFHGVRNVSNAIAHDLRTPLAELRSRLEELSLSLPAEDATAVELEAAVADVDRVIAIFEALLRLAEIDSGVRRSGFVDVDATAAVANAVEFYQPAAELKGITLNARHSDAIPVRGDRVLLEQAIANLIDNALKFTPGNGIVVVDAVRRSDGKVAITVSDNGPGIPDAEKPKASGRFYRGDASRGTPGVGLGLSLVSAVARLHRGTLELRDNDPGLRATMTIEGIQPRTGNSPPAIVAESEGAPAAFDAASAALRGSRAGPGFA